MPLVSVAICMHNGGAYIVEALESVFAQTCQDFEIVLIDDGSTDGSADEVERRFPDPRLRIFRQPQQTLRGARPAAVSHARGGLIAFLDHDDLWMPDKLERQLTLARDTQAALLFSDCLLINPAGRTIARMSDQFDLASIDLDHPHRALLQNGNFIAYSTALVRSDTLRELGGFDRRYQYVSDYDLWLRIARRHRVACSHESLAQYRIHPSQFTQKNADITLAEHNALLHPITKTASYPRPLRVATGDLLLGQHRLAFGHLRRQHRYRAALTAIVGMLRHPTRLRDYVRHRVAPQAIETAISALRSLGQRVRRRVRRARYGRESHIWFDGTALGGAQNGYFNLSVELIRRLAECGVLHVSTDARGRHALTARIGPLAARIRFHRVKARYRPRGHAPANRTTEVLFWRGTFRWRDSRRIAIVQDVTTKVNPEWHTATNVAEFDEYLGYVRLHAHAIATISEQSRRDIIDHVAVDPESIAILPMPIHPQYRTPRLDPSFAFAKPYVLCAGTIEPRKNLRRLVAAFESIATSQILVLAGPAGWDPEFLAELRSERVHYAGFVELERMPSLYHFASAVIYPSLYEGFGLPLFEAMCSSAAVLSSNTSSMPEVVGRDLITFDPHQPEEIANALRRALAMSLEESAAYRRRCRARAELLLERFDAQPPLPGIR